MPFISTPQRLILIIQLCFAFSLFFWYLFQPFMGEYFTLRSRMLLYEYIMGRTEHFTILSEEDQKMVRDDYHLLQIYAQRPTLQKIENGLHAFIRKLPPFEQAWIFFAITISILILMRREGAPKTAWLLPLIVLAYCIDNQLTGYSHLVSPDEVLLPTEQILIEQYLHEPFGNSPQAQKEQLERSWKKYLVKEWSSMPDVEHQLQIEEGEFNFTLARVKKLHGQPLSEWLDHYHQKLAILPLCLYLIWNCFFTWMMTRYGDGTRKYIPIPAK